MHRAPRTLILLVTARCWCQLSRIGPKVLCSCNQRWNLGLLRIKQALARRTNGVVGSKGKKIPKKPSTKLTLPTIFKPNLRISMMRSGYCLKTCISVKYSNPSKGCRKGGNEENRNKSQKIKDIIRLFKIFVCHRIASLVLIQCILSFVNLSLTYWNIFVWRTITQKSHNKHRKNIRLFIVTLWTKHYRHGIYPN